MENKKKTAIFAGRFQPFHKGHLEAAKWILKRHDFVIIAVGSIQDYWSKSNPFTFRERKTMIESALLAENISAFKIIPLPDFQNDAEWSKKLLWLAKTKPGQTVIYSLNPWTVQAAKKLSIEVGEHPFFFGDLCATQIRENIFNREDWKGQVPKPVLNYLKDINGEERISQLQKPLEERIIRFMDAELAKSGLKGVVVAVSGGLDSAVVAALAKRAFGKKAQFLWLPFFKTCPFGKNVSLLEKSLKIKVKRIFLDKVIENFAKVLPRGGNLVYGNLKPRIRMAVVYYFANLKKLLVIGTTNRSELELGYFTKYGDGGVDVEPIADLYKTEVFELAKELKIPQEVIHTVPTAALWPGQSDEKELGLSYFKLDTVLSLDDQGFSRKEISELTDIKLEKIGQILERKKINAHKFAMPPVCKLKDIDNKTNL